MGRNRCSTTLIATRSWLSCHQLAGLFFTGASFFLSGSMSPGETRRRLSRVKAAGDLAALGVEGSPLASPGEPSLVTALIAPAPGSDCKGLRSLLNRSRRAGRPQSASGVAIMNNDHLFVVLIILLACCLQHCSFLCCSFAEAAPVQLRALSSSSRFAPPTCWAIRH